MRAEERPRERALASGITALSNRELLALIIRNGYANVSALELADQLLMQYGMHQLASLSVKELMSYKGLKEAKALEIAACFELSRRYLKEACRKQDVIEDSGNMIEWLKHEIGPLKQEHFLCVYLDMSNHIITHKTMFVGTLNSSIAHPREIFKMAMECSAAKVVVVHNHPSGNLTPSRQDLELTRTLMETGNLVGIPLADHLIVSEEQAISVLRYLQ